MAKPTFDVIAMKIAYFIRIRGLHKAISNSERSTSLTVIPIRSEESKAYPNIRLSACPHRQARLRRQYYVYTLTNSVGTRCVGITNGLPRWRDLLLEWYDDCEELL